MPKLVCEHQLYGGWKPSAIKVNNDAPYWDWSIILCNGRADCGSLLWAKRLAPRNAGMAIAHLLEVTEYRGLCGKVMEIY